MVKSRLKFLIGCFWLVNLMYVLCSNLFPTWLHMCSILLYLIIGILFHRFAKASESARTDWSVFTKGYFLNRNTLVAVLLLVDASVPPQKIDLDCANWLGRNKVYYSFVQHIC